MDLDLNPGWNLLEEFTSDLIRKSSNLAHLLKDNNSNKSQKLLENICGNAELIELFGARPNTVNIHLENGHTYDRWFRELWGRRCAYYMSIFSSGIRAGTKAFGNATSIRKELVEIVAHQAKSLKSAYSRCNVRSLTPELSLKERGDIAPFHQTYLDPVLFSSLLMLAQHKMGDVDLSTRSIGILQKNVVKELLLYTRNGESIIFSIADESTIWWAISYLIKSIETNQLVSGAESPSVQELLSICRTLIERRDILYPENVLALKEATPEIYGEIRTRMLIAKNCISILGDTSSDNFLTASATLWPHLDEQLRVITRSEEYLSHIYFLGLGLELTSDFHVLLERFGLAIKSSFEINEVTMPGVNDSVYAKVINSDINESGSKIGRASCRERV